MYWASVLHPQALMLIISKLLLKIKNHQKKKEREKNYPDHFVTVDHVSMIICSEQGWLKLFQSKRKMN